MSREGPVRLGIISTANYAPVRTRLRPDRLPFGVELSLGYPSQLNSELAAGRLDLSAISAMHFLRHRDRLRLIPGLSISCRGTVGSVLLLGERQPADCRRVAITTTSATSAAMLQVILRRLAPGALLVTSPPDLDAMLSQADLALLIGDHALLAAHQHPELVRLDLGEAWEELTGGPAIYGLWAASEKFARQHPDRLAAVSEELLRARDRGLSDLAAVAAEEALRLGLPASQLEEYLGRFMFHLDAELTGALEELERRAMGKDEGGKQKDEVGQVIASVNCRSKTSRDNKSLGPGSVSEILARARAGERITPEQGATLLRSRTLLAVGEVAHQLRLRRAPPDLVTFCIDRNISYTNICTCRCRFCAFYRLPGADGAYLLPLEDILRKVEELVAIGGNQVMLQGGLHPGLGLDFYLEMLSAIKQKFGVRLHSLSPPEVFHLARQESLSLRETLTLLKQAGLDSLPGGGAEILSEPVRRRISPHKITADQWIEVVRTAHELGIRSTVTMVYGVGETPEQRVEHLERARALQQQTGGFTAFIPWSFQPDGTDLAGLERADGLEYLITVALARIYLDNLTNIQAGWVTEGPQMAQLALAFGANDLGGILMEEEVVRATGVINSVSVQDALRLIRATGKTPAQRDASYQIQRVFVGAGIGAQREDHPVF